MNRADTLVLSRFGLFNHRAVAATVEVVATAAVAAEVMTIIAEEAVDMYVLLSRFFDRDESARSNTLVFALLPFQTTERRRRILRRSWRILSWRRRGLRLVFCV